MLAFDLPRAVRGVAHKYGVWTEPSFACADMRFARAVFRPGAFDDALRSIRKGRELPLLVAHDPNEVLATSRLTDMDLRASGDELLFRMRLNTREARLAAYVIRAAGLWQLSIGFRMTGYSVLPTGGTSADFEVWRAEITDVSVCERGSCPGCHVQRF
jgi:HK97 family phage prohead protease